MQSLVISTTQNEAALEKVKDGAHEFSNFDGRVSNNVEHVSSRFQSIQRMLKVSDFKSVSVAFPAYILLMSRTPSFLRI